MCKFFWPILAHLGPGSQLKPVLESVFSLNICKIEVNNCPCLLCQIKAVNEMSHVKGLIQELLQSELSTSGLDFNFYG